MEAERTRWYEIARPWYLSGPGAGWKRPCLPNIGLLDRTGWSSWELWAGSAGLSSSLALALAAEDFAAVVPGDPFGEASGEPELGEVAVFDDVVGVGFGVGLFGVVFPGLDGAGDVVGVDVEVACDFGDGDVDGFVHVRSCSLVRLRRCLGCRGVL